MPTNVVVAAVVVAAVVVAAVVVFLRLLLFVAFNKGVLVRT